MKTASVTFCSAKPVFSSALLLVWKLACAAPHCGNRRFRIGQRKQIIRTHRQSETGSDYAGLVRSTGLEPVRSPTRPSNVRVCQFRHDRRTGIIITPAHPFVKGYAGENLRSFARRTDRFRKKREVRQGEMDGGEGRAHLEQPGVRLLRFCSPNNAPRVARRGAVPSFHSFRRFSST